MSKPILCLHHNDADGRASAAIVRRALGSAVRLQEMTYGEPTPWKEIEQAEKVIVVDFTLPPGEMISIAGSRQLVWIDHHITAIEDLAHVAAAWPGKRDISESACVLAWQYFFPQHPLPRAIFLIGDRDIWRLSDPDSSFFGEGLYHQDTRPYRDELWKPLLDNEPDLVAELIRKGHLYLEVRLRNIRRTVNRHSFSVLFEGYRTLAVNHRGDGDLGQHMRELGYEIAYCYVDEYQNDHLATFVTMFSAGVDVSAIARKFGGGGHPGAAGFNFPRGATPFPEGARVEYVKRETGSVKRET